MFVGEGETARQAGTSLFNSRARSLRADGASCHQVEPGQSSRPLHPLFASCQQPCGSSLLGRASPPAGASTGL